MLVSQMAGVGRQICWSVMQLGYLIASLGRQAGMLFNKTGGLGSQIGRYDGQSISCGSRQEHAC